MSARVLCILGLCLAVTVGCAANGGGEPREDGGPTDGGRRRDGGIPLVDGGDGTDGGGTTDGGTGSDGGTMTDGGTADSGGDTDAGTAIAITVDGTIDVAEWAGAPSATSTTATAWTGNTLTRLLATVRDDSLYIAVEGTLEAGAENAILVYVDNERGSGTGVEDPITLTDGSGALDNALSAGITTPADFEADFAWGTRDMSRSASGFDDRMGFRDIATNPADFGWIDAAEAPATCGATACEARIPLARLGGSATGTIALFGRLGNTDGTMLSNQTVPMDDPSTPGAVSMVLSVPR